MERVDSCVGPSTRPGSDDRTSGDSPVLQWRHGEVAVLSLNRPRRRNALNREMLVALGTALAGLRADERATAVVLTGEGSAFCAGVDISPEGRQGFYLPPQQHERLYQEHGQSIVRALRSLPQMTVAAVNGPAIGWGACLAPCCAFRVVADTAFFRIPEIGLGMYYDVGCLWGLLSLVGPARARAMVMLGEDVAAREATLSGLADRIAAPDAVLQETLDFCRTLRSRAADSRRVIKVLLRAATTARMRRLALMEVETTAAFYGSGADRAEGLASFHERRPPLFSRECETGTLTGAPHLLQGGNAHGLPSDRSGADASGDGARVREERD